MSFALLGERPQKVPSVTVGPTPTYRVGPLIRNGQPTAHCFEFLRWAVEFHRPYWLTTRDAHGQHTGILRAFRHAVGSPELPAAIETLLRAVRPTEWFGSKITG